MNALSAEEASVAATGCLAVRAHLELIGHASKFTVFRSGVYNGWGHKKVDSLTFKTSTDYLLFLIVGLFERNLLWIDKYLASIEQCFLLAVEVTSKLSIAQLEQSTPTGLLVLYHACQTGVHGALYKFGKVYAVLSVRAGVGVVVEAQSALRVGAARCFLVFS